MEIRGGPSSTRVNADLCSGHGLDKWMDPDLSVAVKQGEETHMLWDSSYQMSIDVLRDESLMHTLS